MSQVAEPAAPPADDTSYDGLRLRGVTKSFGSFTAVRELDLDIPRGSFFALLGPSGCGKTTTLRMVAGLDTPTAGTITLAGNDITYAKPYRRPVNTVFQNYALFPHLDIYENVAFGLKRRKVGDVDAKVREMLSLVELDSQVRKRPAQLSGGQQQRVALARALINEPEVLLLDEPLGALDLKLRRGMQIELKRIQTEVGLTFVHVTHDQEEAMTMADTVAVMNGGVIEQMGAPEELYENPHTTFVANFLGQSNLIEGAIKGRHADLVTVHMHGIDVSIPAARSHADGDSGWIGIRPEKVLIGDPGEELDAPGSSIPGGVVSDVSFVGVSTQ
jgi:spermidine/putrescine transport system ATP-binding protein